MTTNANTGSLLESVRYLAIIGGAPPSLTPNIEQSEGLSQPWPNAQNSIIGSLQLLHCGTLLR